MPSAATRRPPTIREEDPAPGPGGAGLPSARWTTGSLGTVMSGTVVAGTHGAVDVVVVVVDVVVVGSHGVVDVVVDDRDGEAGDDVAVGSAPDEAWFRGAAALPAGWAWVAVCGWPPPLAVAGAVVVVVPGPDEQMESYCGGVRGAGSLGRPVPGFWKRHPSTSPGVTVPNAPEDAYTQLPVPPVKYDQ